MIITKACKDELYEQIVYKISKLSDDVDVEDILLDLKEYNNMR